MVARASPSEIMAAKTSGPSTHSETESLATAVPGTYIKGMRVKLLAFAQTRHQLGFEERSIECASHETPRAIIARVAPGLDVASLRAAIDCEYWDWDAAIGEARELALLPPVSGG
jgi:molybdopterin synthase sulfur carrier subunit